MSKTPLLDKPGEDPVLREILDHFARQHDRFSRKAGRIRGILRISLRMPGYSAEETERIVRSAEKARDRFGRWRDALQRIMESGLDKPADAG